MITPDTLPLGAAYLPGFLSSQDEAALVTNLDALPWSEELKRRVQHFGYRYDYRARMVTPDVRLGDLPDWLLVLGERLRAAGCLAAMPDQVIANEYRPGQGISAHVDCVPCFGEIIVSVSLLSPCVMIFRKKADGDRRSILLEPRSALVMSGEARYDWTHEIPARRSDTIGGAPLARTRRISLTLRTVLLDRQA
ncbi:alpha-ketoglutarate-dependent dioxygenase AlkB [Ciceribacter sp. L1K22]|uniref:alpha-ketoglutarate-dependent dioxygenase AlkB n=1 Tax=Ciceribacter sp. L1K22 TaxID=2820275 RepID=UPI001ABE7445|nr:alpha-ketoglutarate-dependent dioxygenase AlkB [Ciceribacter sp. L1K22]MBO3761938.1 alpha-ketoglutarate-dependent dioxygenase AlkB [Ciceribacter sp. L1K22]